MGHKFADLLFTPGVQELQREQGSREGYKEWETAPDFNHLIDEPITSFLAERDSFYMASVNEDGWPYVQHRGGPKGFMRVLDEQTIGFADYQGNRQYISTGNLRHDHRVSLFFMDYPNKRRLKVLGRVEIISLDQPAELAKLDRPEYGATVERGFRIHVEAYDWNCPQHITPRFDQGQIEEIIAPLREEIDRLKTTAPQQPDSPAQGEGPLPLVISGMRQLTPRVRGYEFRHADGEPLPKVRAGANLTVPIRLENGEAVMRNYSICSDPAQQEVYEIAVLREDAGSGGSAAVHQQFKLDLPLNVQVPTNHFALHDDQRPAVLLAGGIGITPIAAMAHELHARGTSFALHYTGRSRREMAFLNQLRKKWGSAFTSYNKSDGERLPVMDILGDAPSNAVIYVCGPNGLIDGTREAAETLGIAPEQVQYERFVALKKPDDRAFTLELRRSQKTISVRANQSLLEAIEGTGVKALSSCRTGTCRTCVVKVLDGKADHRDSVLSESERNDEKLICPCVSRAAGDHLILDI